MKAKEKVKGVIDDLTKRVVELNDSLKTVNNLLATYKDFLDMLQEDEDRASGLGETSNKPFKEFPDKMNWNSLCALSRLGLERLIEEKNLSLNPDFDYDQTEHGLAFLRQDIAISLNIDYPKLNVKNNMKTEEEIQQEIERLAHSIEVTEQSILEEKKNITDWKFTIAHLQWCLQDLPYQAPIHKSTTTPKYLNWQYIMTLSRPELEAIFVQWVDEVTTNIDLNNYPNTVKGNLDLSEDIAAELKILRTPVK